LMALSTPIAADFRTGCAQGDNAISWPVRELPREGAMHGEQTNHKTLESG